MKPEGQVEGLSLFAVKRAVGCPAGLSAVTKCFVPLLPMHEALAMHGSSALEMCLL